MKVILGLGNPGTEYAGTRHNAGLWVLDHLVEAWRFDGWRKDGDALTSSGLVGNTKVLNRSTLVFEGNGSGEYPLGISLEYAGYMWAHNGAPVG